jgi:hypothetical protein
MSAYDRGSLSVDAYLVRLLAAIVRQAGGELRVKGELIDRINEPTTLIKEWDCKTQELVLRAGMHSFTEVFRVVPEKPVGRDISAEAPTSGPKPEPRGDFLPKTNTFDNPQLSEIERKQRVARAVALVREELRRRREAGA